MHAIVGSGSHQTCSADKLMYRMLRHAARVLRPHAFSRAADLFSHVMPSWCLGHQLWGYAANSHRLPKIVHACQCETSHAHRSHLKAASGKQCADPSCVEHQARGGAQAAVAGGGARRVPGGGNGERLLCRGEGRGAGGVPLLPRQPALQGAAGSLAALFLDLLDTRQPALQSGGDWLIGRCPFWTPDSRR